ncbi:MAG: anhydro-N-acetylmuramic acid kinase [Acidobacteriaceae bacterium]
MLKQQAARAMTVAGVMSGTSADGIDVAICRIGPGSARAARTSTFPAIDLRLHRASAYPATLRKAVLAAMNADSTSAAELARLHWRLGQAYAEAVATAVADYGRPIDLVGCHGQTIYHQGVASNYAGRSVACTWQLGEAALIAAAIGVPVVSNFRPADMAAGGQGAPLVPLLDFALFRHLRRARVLQNLGGIGNLSAIPPGGTPADLLAFDTGPANMVIDGLTARLFAKPYDLDGRIAAAGTVHPRLLAGLLRDPFYRKTPPKSAGREQYGVLFVDRILADAARLKLSAPDTVATATALTAASIRIAHERFVMPHFEKHARSSGASSPVEYIVSGGGARNRTLLRMLAEELAPFGCTVAPIDALGVPSEAKEAVAFALLAWQTWHRLPGNVPAATGATRPAILGQVTYV